MSHTSVYQVLFSTALIRLPPELAYEMQGNIGYAASQSRSNVPFYDSFAGLADMACTTRFFCHGNATLMYNASAPPSAFHQASHK